MKRELKAMIRLHGVKQFRKALVETFYALADEAYAKEGDDSGRGLVYGQAAEWVDGIGNITIPKGTRV